MRLLCQFFPDLIILSERIAAAAFVQLLVYRLNLGQLARIV